MIKGWEIRVVVQDNGGVIYDIWVTAEEWKQRRCDDVKGWEILSLEEWKQRGDDDTYAGEVS